MGTFVDTISNAPEKTCPYNPTHVVPARKFTAHIMECARNHPNADFVTCPYHAKHRMAKCLVYEHLDLCEFMEIGVVTKEQLALYAEWAGITLDCPKSAEPKEKDPEKKEMEKPKHEFKILD